MLNNFKMVISKIQEMVLVSTLRNSGFVQHYPFDFVIVFEDGNNVVVVS
jgi:hypothetical protein